MSNDFLKNSFLYSDEWNSFIKSYKSMMEEYRKSIISMNTTLEPAVKTLKEAVSALSSTYVEYGKRYSTQISKIMEEVRIRDVINYSLKIQEFPITRTLKEYNWSDIFNNYSLILSNIDFNQVGINEEGTITYQEEEVKIDNNDIKNAINTFNSVHENPSAIREIPNNKKSKIIAIVIFIVLGVATGFLNKCGETLFDCVSNAFYNHVKEDERNTKDSFIEKYRFVNANELNVRECGTTDSKIIGKLYLNQCVEVIDKINYWTKIKYVNKEKNIEIVGWVYTRYLSYIDEKTLTLDEESENI